MLGFALFRAFSAGMDPILPGWLPAPHLIRSRRARDRLRRDLLACSTTAANTPPIRPTSSRPLPRPATPTAARRRTWC